MFLRSAVADAPTETPLTGNTHDAIEVYGDRSRTVLNSVTGCHSHGIVVQSYNTWAFVSLNRVTLTNCAFGDAGFVVGNATANSRPFGRVRGNVSTGSNYGIEVADTGALIASNTANSNAATGITVAGYAGAPPNTVTGNTANNNGFIGISAEAGTIDGGGNTASGNGTANCVNVTCSP
jgi:hypothetical protein